MYNHTWCTFEVHECQLSLITVQMKRKKRGKEVTRYNSKEVLPLEEHFLLGCT